jgi:hypothetical protein
MAPTRRVVLMGSAMICGCVVFFGDQLRSQSHTYLQTFDGSPSTPQPWRPSDWDVTANAADAYRQDDGNSIEPMEAEHGSACAPAPDVHHITTLDDAVFLCRDHVMTAMNYGYGAVYLTPNQLVDFSGGPAVVRFDMSTQRRSDRDWIDLWITPYDEHLQIPLEEWLPVYAGEPRRALHVRMDNGGGGTVFRVSVVREFESEGVPGSEWRSVETFVTPSAIVRTPFELRLSRTHVRFGLPGANVWWVDAAIPDLGWSQGVVQFGHHSYDQKKGACLSGGCGPNTWHWDNVSIAPAIPFTILRGAPKILREDRATRLDFPAPSPANAHLRFIAVGNALEVSYDGGATWQPALLKVQERVKEEHYRTFWTPVPAGVRSVQVRGRSFWGGGWEVRDASIWSRSTGPVPAPPGNLRILGGS